MLPRINFKQRIKLKPPIDPSIKAQLDSLGLQPTGSKEGDLAAIKAALNEQSINTDKADKASSLMGAPDQNKPAPPWLTLLQELKIRPTGSKEGDFAAIAARLTTINSQATTQAEQAKVATLISNFNALGGSLKAQASHDKSSELQAHKPIDYLGQNQVAELNKYFLIKRNYL